MKPVGPARAGCGSHIGVAAPAGRGSPVPGRWGAHVAWSVQGSGREGAATTLTSQAQQEVAVLSSTAVVPGSLGQVAQAKGESIAQAFMSCEIVALIDTSGSMAANDSRGGRQRYAVACDELAKLQAAHPGKVGVVAFSTTVQFEPGGVPTFLRGGTNLAAALKFARIVDGTVRFVVVSDGEPDSEHEALAEAATMQSEISCIFVGAEGDTDARDFLRRLAKSRGGRFSEAQAGDLLADRVESLFLKSSW